MTASRPSTAARRFRSTGWSNSAGSCRAPSSCTRSISNRPTWRKLAAGGVSVVHCPSAALRHVKGIHRYGLFPEMLAAGMPVALGGDSANGSNHLNMLRLMYLASTLYKDFRMDTTMIPPETALEMATIHGARALGLQDQIGSLEPGKRADFVVFSTEQPGVAAALAPGAKSGPGCIRSQHCLGLGGWAQTRRRRAPAHARHRGAVRTGRCRRPGHSRADRAPGSLSLAPHSMKDDVR